MVMALSFHSTIEGLALALEDEASGVWLNTGPFKNPCNNFWLNTGPPSNLLMMLKFLGATALHKFVISFSVGMELVSNKVIQFTYFPSEY